MTPTTLNSIELPATDLAASRVFYSTNFGWTFTEYGPTYSAADAAGFEVGFNTEAPVATPQEYGEQSACGPLLLLQTADLAALHAEMVDAQVDIVTAPFGFPGGRRFHFRDPNGNVLAAYEYD